MTQSPMFPHQSTAVERLAVGIPTYLGFDMGIGKSRTFIEAVKEAGEARVLVICPKSAVLVWQREIKLWDPGASSIHALQPASLKAGPKYTIITHGAMSQKNGWVAETLRLCPPFGMTCIDEAHGFNDSQSNRSKVLRQTMPKLGFVVPMSGTPMRNHAGDLYHLISVCAPEVLKTRSGAAMNRHEFEDQFCVVGSRWIGGRQIRVIEGSKNLSRLKSMIAPWMVRVRKEDVLKDLPPIAWQIVPVDPDTTFLSDADLWDLEQLAPNIDQWLKPTADKHVMRLRRQLGLAKLRGAGEFIVDMLDNLMGYRKVLVFAVHKDVVSHLKHHLAEYNPAVITGEVTGKDRDDAYQKFLTDPSCRVFVGNIQAAGTALTLVGPTCKCSDVVFVESSWTPMDNAQAACRVHRIGQQDGVVVRMLAAAGTVDDMIAAILARKSAEFAELFEKGEVQ